MTTATRAHEPILLHSRTRGRSDWWVAAAMAAVVVAMVAGLARHVDPQTLVDEKPATLLLD